jgi:hypothetical protein
LALRELMCIEMPDHQDDLAMLPGTTVRSTGLVYNNPAGAPVNLYVSTPSTSRAIRLQSRLLPGWDTTNANAELLYLVIEDSSLNGSSAIELFGKSEIADVDNDGLSEFVDAYRRPIQWLRWPTGFTGIVRYVPDPWDQTLSFNIRGELEGEAIDRSRADPGYVSTDVNLRPGIATYPLVVSSGVDGRFGLRFSLEGVTSGLTTIGSRSAKDVTFPVSYSAAQGPLVMPDPWFPREDPLNRLGSILDLNAFQDDVTNYSSDGANL